MKTHYPVVVLILLVASIGNQSAFGQEIRRAMSGGKKYVGEPFQVKLTLSGFGNQQASAKFVGEDDPEVSIGPPQFGQSRMSINGFVTQSVSFTYTITVLKKGEVKIGPFEVEVDGEKVETEPIFFNADIEEIAQDPDLELTLKFPDRNVYVGERVPVEIEFGWFGDRREADLVFRELSLQSAFFDEFRFEDFRVQRGENYFLLKTSQGENAVLARKTIEKRRDEEITVFRGTRFLSAESAGEFQDIQINGNAKRPDSYGRDFFGDEVVRSMARCAVKSKPVTLNILPVPIGGRPKSFSGAVGESYSISAAAKRSVIRVGDPVSVTITVSGSGRLDSIVLPLTQDSGLLDSGDFELPAEPPSGSIDGDEKLFNLQLRANNVDIAEIPALPLSWFDPVAEKFQTVYSDPIALQVREAEIISSKDVVSAAPKPQNSEAKKTPVMDIAAELELVGANLAIEQNTAKLLGSTLDSRPWLAWVFYAAAFAILIGTAILQFRKKVDVESVAKQQQTADQHRSIGRAATLPPREGAREVAEALRKLLAQNPQADRQDVEKIVAKCDALVYAPTEPSKAEFERLVQLAADAAKKLEGNA
ncbi:MAG: BatD family protein [Planctomycetota bacterium]